MSKPNTIHIIGFDVNTSTVTVPAIVDVNSVEGYYVAGYIDNDYFE